MKLLTAPCYNLVDTLVTECQCNRLVIQESLINPQRYDSGSIRLERSLTIAQADIWSLPFCSLVYAAIEKQQTHPTHGCAQDLGYW